MNTTQHQDRDLSQLFLVRLWAEQGREESSDSDSASPNAEIEWHGSVQHIVSGEAHSFHDWPALVDLLLAMLPSAEGEHPEGSDR